MQMQWEAVELYCQIETIVERGRGNREGRGSTPNDSQCQKLQGLSLIHDA